MYALQRTWVMVGILLVSGGATIMGNTKKIRVVKSIRVPEYKINEIFVNRWSARAMSGELVRDDELMSLFEAARWAPSSYNVQPWRFIYAKKDTKYWDCLFNLLVPFNQSWVKNAAVLVVVVSHNITEHNGKKMPFPTHTFDTGAAWQNMALQGSIMGLVVHGMAGFDYERARRELNIPDDYTVEAMIAIGRPGKKENLPTDLQQGEQPSSRKKVKEFIYEGMLK